MIETRKSATGWNTVVRKQGMLNIRPISPSSISRALWLARRALVGLSIALAIGATTVGTGRTIDPRSGGSTSMQNVLQPRLTEKPAIASARLDELLHDIAGDEAPLHSAAVSREMVSANELRNATHRTRVIWMEVTAYCACKKCCGPNAIGLTASGRDVGYNGGRFVAADTSLLPFGTKLRIPGYSNEQPVEVIDRGSAIKGNKLDVFYASHEEAIRWGRQMIRVTIVE